MLALLFSLLVLAPGHARMPLSEDNVCATLLDQLRDRLPPSTDPERASDLNARGAPRAVDRLRESLPEWASYDADERTWLEGATERPVFHDDRGFSLTDVIRGEADINTFLDGVDRDASTRQKNLVSGIRPWRLMSGRHAAGGALLIAALGANALIGDLLWNTWANQDLSTLTVALDQVAALTWAGLFVPRIWAEFRPLTTIEGRSDQLIGRLGDMPSHFIRLLKTGAGHPDKDDGWDRRGVTASILMFKDTAFLSRADVERVLEATPEEIERVTAELIARPVLARLPKWFGPVKAKIDTAPKDVVGVHYEGRIFFDPKTAERLLVIRTWARLKD